MGTQNRRFQAQRFKLIRASGIVPDDWQRVDGLGEPRDTPELALADIDAGKPPEGDGAHYMDAIVILT